MARKKLPSTYVGPDWFLAEWMKYYKLKQKDLAEKTGWSASTVSEIINGKTHYYREIVNVLASALNIMPYELLMHPDAAHQLRALQQAGLNIADDTRKGFLPEPNWSKKTASG